MTKHWLGATVLVCLAAITTYSSPQSTSVGPAFKDGELLVKFYASVPASRRDAILASRSGRRLHHFGTLDIDHVTIGNGANVANAVAALAVLPEVQAVQPNYVRHIVQNAAAPTDPYWLNGTLWGLSQIQANVVWNTMGDTGNGTVVIADIDTGIDYTHPDLQANIWNNPGNIPGDTYTHDLHGINVSASPATGDPMDDNGHGTHTAGTLAAVGNNGIGVVGVNWNAKAPRLQVPRLDRQRYGCRRDRMLQLRRRAQSRGRQYPGHQQQLGRNEKRGGCRRPSRARSMRSATPTS